jgi:preprotein translocase subunit SecG
MQGLGRLTYWLGWVFLALAVFARILVYTSLRDRLVDSGVLPRNFFELAFIFFVISIASSLMEQQKT